MSIERLDQDSMPVLEMDVREDDFQNIIASTWFPNFEKLLVSLKFSEQVAVIKLFMWRLENHKVSKEDQSSFTVSTSENYLLNLDGIDVFHKNEVWNDNNLREILNNSRVDFCNLAHQYKRHAEMSISSMSPYVLDDPRIITKKGSFRKSVKGMRLDQVLRSPVFNPALRIEISKSSKLNWNKVGEHNVYYNSCTGRYHFADGKLVHVLPGDKLLAYKNNEDTNVVSPEYSEKPPFDFANIISVEKDHSWTKAVIQEMKEIYWVEIVKSLLFYLYENPYEFNLGENAIYNATVNAYWFNINIVKWLLETQKKTPDKRKTWRDICLDYEKNLQEFIQIEDDFDIVIFVWWWNNTEWIWDDHNGWFSNLPKYKEQLDANYNNKLIDYSFSINDSIYEWAEFLIENIISSCEKANEWKVLVSINLHGSESGWLGYGPWPSKNLSKELEHNREMRKKSQWTQDESKYRDISINLNKQIEEQRKKSTITPEMLSKLANIQNLVLDIDSCFWGSQINHDSLSWTNLNISSLWTYSYASFRQKLIDAYIDNKWDANGDGRVSHNEARVYAMMNYEYSLMYSTFKDSNGQMKYVENDNWGSMNWFLDW